MTASAMAGELGLPLFTLRLDSVFTRYLGETASKLRLVFDQIAAMRGVYLFDEFDAIGAKRGSARLAGVEAPKFEDNETTIAQLKDRIAKTVAFLKTLDKKAIDASAEREITFPLGPEKKGTMKGDDYLNHFMLPNFYFHCTAAYAILRHLGVEVGKQDFLGAIPMKVS